MNIINLRGKSVATTRKMNISSTVLIRSHGYEVICFNNCSYLIRQSSTEDEEPLVAIDPSDLKTLFGGGDNLQYHDGLTDSDGKTLIFQK